MKLSVPKARKLTKAKSDYQLAQKLGVTRQCVSMWRKRGFIGYAYAEKLNQAGWQINSTSKQTARSPRDAT